MIRPSILVLGALVALGSGCSSSDVCASLLGDVCAHDGGTPPASADAASADAAPVANAPLPFTPSTLGAVDTSGALGELSFTGECSFNYRDDTKARCGDRELEGYRSFEATQDDGSKVRIFLARSVRLPPGAT